MLEVLFFIIIGLLIAGFNGDIKKFIPLQQHELSDQLEKVLVNRLLVDLNRLEIPGLQIALIKDSKLSQLSLGTADYQRKFPLTNQHLLRLGTITKVYTATIIMKLVEQGQLELDMSLEAWFPELPYGKLITIQNLLEQTSGIYNYTENLTFKIKTRLKPKRTWKKAELYNYILRGKPHSPPGAKHFYSHSNYLLLGLIAESVSGKELSELLDQWIFYPHSLLHTSLQPLDQIPPLLVTGYVRNMIPVGLREHLPTNRAWSSSGYSSGGIVSTASDTAQFLHLLFSYDILKKETLDKMLQFSSCQNPDLPEQTGYGLGLCRLELEKDTLWGHFGIIPGFGGAAFYCPERNYYLVILGNISHLNLTQLLSTSILSIHEHEQYGVPKDTPIYQAG